MPSTPELMLHSAPDPLTQLLIHQIARSPTWEKGQGIFKAKMRQARLDSASSWTLLEPGVVVVFILICIFYVFFFFSLFPLLGIFE